MMIENTLTLPHISNQIDKVFKRMLMLQELTRLAIESLPNSTDSDVPVALLNGMKEILTNDTHDMMQLIERIDSQSDQLPALAND